MKTRLPLCVLAVLALAGLPASCTPSSGTHEFVNVCDDMDSVFSWCQNSQSDGQCEGAPAEFEAPCHDGCVLHQCQKVHRCDREPSARWCGTSCADKHGALYWKNLQWAQIHCQAETRSTNHAQPAFGECIVSFAEEQCPELKGTRWAAEYRGFGPKSLYPAGK